MPGDRRTEAEIRREIAAEREQLADALADLRAGTGDKRRLAALAAGPLAAGLGLAALRRAVRRRGARRS